MANLTYTGTGADTRISPDPTTATGSATLRIPTDPVLAGLAPGTTLSPDPTTASSQVITVL